MTTEAAPGHETGIASQAVATPVGTLGIVATNDAVVRVMWASTNEQRHKEEKALWDGDNSLLAEAVRQIQAYFAGKLNTFDLPLAPAGTEFQQQVYRQMSAIAYGQTRSYGALAAALGTAAQPVGQACGSNPIPVIIPCHRVLAANGLGGYSGAGGIETKIALLKHENALPYLL